MGQAIRRRCRGLLFLLTLLPGCAVLENACWQTSLTPYTKAKLPVTRVLDRAIDDYKSLVEETLSHRARTIQLAGRLKERIQEDEPLSGADLDSLNQSMLEHMRIRDRLYAVARQHECWIDASLEDFREAGLGEVSRRDQLKAIMLSLSAALLLYDNYLLLTSIFVEDAHLRRLLNERHSGYNIGLRKLDEITMSYTSVAKRERVRRAMRFYERYVTDPSVTRSKDARFVYLHTLIEQSPSYAMTRTYSPLFVVGQKLKFMSAITADTLNELTGAGPTLFSSLFGNSVGLVETRTGKLYDRPEILRALSDQLKPGDILLEKTPFRLTDQLIPGYWGHAAIWVGTEAELKQLGIWSNPIVTQYHAAIERGRSILEVLRSGVQLNTLERFLNVDSLALLRHTGLDREQLQKRIVLGLRQIGKQYDFRFDLETTDELFCTELIYLVHSEIAWPHSKLLGQHTMSPDQIAVQALHDGPLQLITLYHDGELVLERRREVLAELLNIGTEPAASASAH